MKTLLFIVAFLFSLAALRSQNTFTIYAIPAAKPYDWSSPRTLYKSYLSNYIKNIFRKDSYLLGHAFIELRTPLAPDGIFTGMRSASKRESRDLARKQHYGLAVLGADVAGELESPEDLERKVEKFSKKGLLAFMTFQISDEAAEKMISFFEAYRSDTNISPMPCERYGGAFWPRFRGEGAGCSAFVVSFLDLAGILQDQYKEWLVAINIPMDLIGGPYNNYREVRLGDIRKYDSWASPDDTAAYEQFEIYDPTLMYQWIHEKIGLAGQPGGIAVTPLELNKAGGIVIDSRNVPVPDEESLFQERGKPSIFIDYYFKRNTEGR